MRDPTPRPRLAFGRRWPTTIASAALVLAAGAWQTAAAQETAGAVDLRLRIVAESTGAPVPDASVSLLAEDSVLVDHAVSDGEGRAALEAPPGSYRIRVERMDLEPWTSEPFTVQEGEERTIRIPLRPVTLPGLDVETEGGLRQLGAAPSVTMDGPPSRGRTSAASGAYAGSVLTHEFRRPEAVFEPRGPPGKS